MRSEARLRIIYGGSAVIRERMGTLFQARCLGEASGLNTR